MKYKSIKVYKTTFCADCLITERFFEENNIGNVETVNIDKDEKAAEYLVSLNNGLRSVPTIVIEADNNGSFVLVEPSWKDLESTFK